MSDKNSCEQCGVCCKLFFINLNETEFRSGEFQTIFDDVEIDKDFALISDCGANFLAKNEAGACVYLQDNCCKIHNRRPQVCRAFFCKDDSLEFEEMRNIITKNKK